MLHVTTWLAVTGELKATSTNPFPLVLDSNLLLECWVVFMNWCAPTSASSLLRGFMLLALCIMH